MSQTSTLRKTVEDLKFNLEIYNELNEHLKIVELNIQDEAVRKINRRIVKNLCLGEPIAEAEDEKFSVVYAVKFCSESLDFGVD